MRFHHNFLKLDFLDNGCQVFDGVLLLVLFLLLFRLLVLVQSFTDHTSESFRIRSAFYQSGSLVSIWLIFNP